MESFMKERGLNQYHQVMQQVNQFVRIKVSLRSKQVLTNDTCLVHSIFLGTGNAV